MSKPFIIGLCGFAGSGKSTVAKHLAEYHQFERVNYKDGLVSEMRENFGLVLEEIIKLLENHRPLYDGTKPMTVDWLFENKPPIMRRLMQQYGTEVRRKDNPNYWVKKWLISTNGYKRVVTDDVRFDNECAALKDLNGVLIRVVVDGEEVTPTHPSESEHLKFKEDFVITAKRGDVQSMVNQLEDILAQLNND